MNEQLLEVIKAIDELNEEFYEITKKDDDIFLSFKYFVGGVIQIKFRNVVIWYSEDDDRKFDEDKNEYEPFKQFLKRKVISHLKEEKKFLEKLVK